MSPIDPRAAAASRPDPIAVIVDREGLGDVLLKLPMLRAIGRGFPGRHWIWYRIAVILSDLIMADDLRRQHFRDLVIADPGAVYISGGIYEQIKHKLVCGFQSLEKLKNITDPVRVYCANCRTFSLVFDTRTALVLLAASTRLADARRDAGSGRDR